MIKVNDVVQFVETHKWMGCFGFVEEIKSGRIMVGVPIPEKGIAYIYCKENDIEVVGKSALVSISIKEVE